MFQHLSHRDLSHGPLLYTSMCRPWPVTHRGMVVSENPCASACVQLDIRTHASPPGHSPAGSVPRHCLSAQTLHMMLWGSKPVTSTPNSTPAIVELWFGASCRTDSQGERRQTGTSLMETIQKQVPKAFLGLPEAAF